MKTDDENQPELTERTKRLHQLMAEHKLKAPRVGQLLGRSPHTVRIWRVAGGDRQIPAQALELLEMKLKGEPSA